MHFLADFYFIFYAYGNISWQLDIISSHNHDNYRVENLSLDKREKTGFFYRKLILKMMKVCKFELFSRVWE